MKFSPLDNLAIYHRYVVNLKLFLDKFGSDVSIDSKGHCFYKAAPFISKKL